MLYNVVLVSADQQSEISCTYANVPSLLHFLPIEVTTEHWVEFPMLYHYVLMSHLFHT